MPPADFQDIAMRLIRIETRLELTEKAQEAAMVDVWGAVTRDRQEIREAMKELSDKVDGLEKARDHLLGVRYALYAVLAGLAGLAGLVVHMQIILSNLK